jgi:hypothetical protein
MEERKKNNQIKKRGKIIIFIKKRKIRKNGFLQPELFFFPRNKPGAAAAVLESGVSSPGFSFFYANGDQFVCGPE